ncbi:MAG: hypothetical protein Q8O36_05950, partial [Candidatus Omnitrophota bacterium]|nr:hypothetical protein [Candidatus Omnitrophota bacterium]
KRLLNRKAQEESDPKVEETTPQKAKVKVGNVVGVCPDCGGSLQHVEGCMICKACGYSKCG